MAYEVMKILDPQSPAVEQRAVDHALDDRFYIFRYSRFALACARSRA